MQKTILTLILIPLLSNSVLAQAAQNTPQKALANARTKAIAEREATLFEVFKLQFAEATEATVMLRELAQGAKAIPDMRTNSVLVNGTTEDLDLVRQLLNQIDQPGEPQTRANQIKIFQLQSDANEVYSTIRALQGDKTLTVVDPKTNALIVTGTRTELDELGELIKALDVAPVVQKPLQLRIIWLSSGEKQAAGDGDSRLIPVLKSLERVGIKGLSKKAQMLVNVSEPSSGFAVSGVVGQETSIQVAGDRIGELTTPATLDVQIQVKGTQAPIELEATVRISPNQMVVLGATPTSDSQSVFVVELIEGI